TALNNKAASPVPTKIHQGVFSKRVFKSLLICPFFSAFCWRAGCTLSLVHLKQRKNKIVHKTPMEATANVQPTGVVLILKLHATEFTSWLRSFEKRSTKGCKSMNVIKLPIKAKVIL